MNRTNLDAYVARVVADAPPLSEEQRTTIAYLLRPTQDSSKKPRPNLVIEEAADVLAEMRRNTE